MRTLALLGTLLLVLASPIALGSEGHGAEEPEAHDEEGVSSPELQPGQSFSFNVTEEGTFDYHCHPHPWMLAQLRMLPSNGTPVTHVINITEPADQPFENWTFAPKVMDVRVGDTVTWLNAGTVMHRVSQTVGEHIAHVGTLGGSDGSADADAHADGDDHAHVEASAPGGIWWLVVAALGIGCVFLWVRGNKKAP